MIKVLIADDQKLIRESLKIVLDTYQAFLLFLVSIKFPLNILHLLFYCLTKEEVGCFFSH